MHVAAPVQVAQPVGQSMQRLALAEYVPAGQARQVLILVDRHEEHPKRHWPHLSSLILVKPWLHPPTSQYPAPAVSQVRQLAVQALHVPLVFGVYPGLHLVQNW